MKIGLRARVRNGFTLVELSLAMVIGMAVAAISLLLFNQQMSFIRIFRAQDFLTREAPLINNYVARVIGSAEGYQLYSDKASLTSGGSPVLSNAKVLMLRFRQADGTLRASILSFENPGSGQGLYYTVVPVAGANGSPDWALSKNPQSVKLAVEQGILRMYVDGPNGEQVVYSGSQQL